MKIHPNYDQVCMHRADKMLFPHRMTCVVLTFLLVAIRSGQLIQADQEPSSVLHNESLWDLMSPELTARVSSLSSRLYISQHLASTKSFLHKVTDSRQRGPPSTSQGLSDQSKYVGLDTFGDLSAIVAFGDFNLDMFVDIVVVNPRSMIGGAIAHWNHETYCFDLKQGFQLATLDCKISGVFVADFDNDGKLDVLVTTDSPKHKAELFYGTGLGNFTVGPILDNVSPNSLIVDINGNLQVNVLSYNDDGKLLLFTRNLLTGEFSSEEWDPGFRAGCVPVRGVSPAFADLDGDCLPDLIIPSSCGIHVFLNPGPLGVFKHMTTKSPGYKLLSSSFWNPSNGDSQITFADFNGDGTVDMAFYSANSKEIVVFLNMQSKRKYGNLCTADSSWALERMLGASDVELEGTYLGGSLFTAPTLRAGDFNYDGNLDILARGKSGKIELYRNEGRWKHALDGRRRSLLENSSTVARDTPEPQYALFTGDTALSSISNAVAACFFDLDESGRQDIIVVTGVGYSHVLWNNFINRADSLFFKGTGLSGLPYFGSSPHPFAPVPGTTFKLSFATSDGHMFSACSQCPQGAFLSLQSCSCFFGLVRISNYIEQVAMGTGKASRYWDNMMPNAITVVWPQEVSNPGSWWMEYFTQRRGGQMLGVVIVLCVFLVLLAIVIWYLYWKESQEDKKEKYERAEVFSFGTL